MPAFGRGGAGNIEDASRQEDQNVKMEPKVSQSQLIAQTPRQPYAHMGRGGAGNYYSPTSLENRGSFVTAPVVTSQQSNAAYQGRGGAGNFVGPSGETSSTGNQMSEEEQAAKRVEIEAQVQAALPRPPEQAYLAGKERDARAQDVDDTRTDVAGVVSGAHTSNGGVVVVE